MFHLSLWGYVVPIAGLGALTALPYYSKVLAELRKLIKEARLLIEEVRKLKDTLHNKSRRRKRKTPKPSPRAPRKSKAGIRITV